MQHGDGGGRRKTLTKEEKFSLEVLLKVLHRMQQEELILVVHYV